MLRLPDITLCCIDTRYHVLALRALKHSMRGVDFGDAIFITTGNRVDHNDSLHPIRIIDIEPIASVEEYSRFVLRSLVEHIRTPFVLLIQWDGYIINPQVWSDDFKAFDYIGAPWRLKGGSKLVGNGGFSLRSRKLLEALSSEEMRIHHPEDDCIAKTNRTLLENSHGIRFADPTTADRFSFEFTIPRVPTFGFHGLCHFPDVMSEEELHGFIDTMPRQTVLSGYFPGFLERLHARVKSAPSYSVCLNLAINALSAELAEGLIPEKPLIKSLIRCGMNDLARRCLAARIKSAGYSATNLRLMARYVGRRVGLLP